jgi:hypothetical protein
VKRSSVLSRAWHGVLAAVILASLLTQIVLSARGHDAPAATRFLRLFSYFTIQSNILLLIAAASLTRHPARDGRRWRVLRLDGMLGIVITGLVYATVLAGTAELHGAARLANFGLHYFAPWWALLGWLLFGPRPRIGAHTLLWSVLWPVLWIAYTLAHGAATSWYPYPFTDVTVLGYPTVLINLLVVVLIAIVLGAVLRLLDTRLPRLVR